MRIVEELDECAENVILDREPAANLRREVFKKYADLHLVNIFQLRLKTRTWTGSVPGAVATG